MRAFLFAILVLGACGHGTDPAKGTEVVAPPAPPAEPPVVKAPTPPPEPAPPPAEPAAPADLPVVVEGLDFTDVGKVLAIVGACNDGALPEGYAEAMVAKHCKAVKATQSDYAERWVRPARAFFADRVPTSAPRVVVYPFSGGDLSTALTVYPDADEITTLSLEPAGDPRTLSALNDAATRPVGKAARPNPQARAALERALATIQKELRFLYQVNFSNTLNMIDAMRSGALPTQLIFGLSALKVHGYELVGLRYFKLDERGAVKYLTEEDIATAPDPSTGISDRRQMEKRNRVFANSEIRFRKPGGKLQIHRHLQVDLSDAQLRKDRRVLAHLESKGKISAMTKAASYLLSWDSFSLVRDYLTSHTMWMVSDATGVAPRWGKPAGFEYETYGWFTEPHLDSGRTVAKSWRDEWAAQPRRKLGFRFGYYDKKISDHLVIMKKKG
jgi:hypothetical protein